MKARIAGAALAAAMVTTLVAATPALASPMTTTASPTAAHMAGHGGNGGNHSPGDPWEGASVQYAASLVDAWAVGDASKVDRLATDDVAATLRAFADVGGAMWVRTSSRSLSGLTFSSFVNKLQGKALVLGVQDSLVKGDDAAVVARFVDYPKGTLNPTEYAMALVSAWGLNASAQVNMLATADVAATLREFAAVGGTDWMRTSSRGISGITFSSFVNKDKGKALVIGVQDSLVKGDHAAVIGWFVDFPTHPVTPGKHKGGPAPAGSHHGR